MAAPMSKTAKFGANANASNPTSVQPMPNDKE